MATLRCSTIGSCQSAATSKIVKHAVLVNRVSSAI